MEKVRIQDDLFNNVNGEWIENAVIPNDRPTTGGFADLDKQVEQLMINEFKDMSKSGNYPDKYMERAIRLYNLANNLKKRNKQGIKPALKRVAKIEKLKDISSLNRYIKDFVIENLPLPFSLMVEDNMKDTKHNLLYISGPSTILPDVTYYQNEQQKAALMGMWKNMASMVMSTTPLTQEEQALYIEDTIKFDAIIATLVKSSLEWSEYTKMYNLASVRKVSSLVKPIKFRKLLEKVFGFVPENVSIADVRFLKGFKTLFNEETFILYKHWAYVTELIDCTQFLSEDLRNIGGSFRRALTGVPEMPKPDVFAYHLASSLFSEPIGIYYGKKYFGEEAKKDVVSMVKDIIETYKKRVKANDFLLPETKDKAVLKLSKMEIKMGYPDAVEDIYNKLDFNEKANLLDAVLELNQIRRVDKFAQLNKETNHKKWAMPGHMVNACYNPTSNDITFPAAILQAPFYSIKQSRSQNLGGIGAVIGHEISHAFDNNGANCDENGNLFNWWGKQDEKAFKAKTKLMIKEFEGIQLPWGPVNSELIVSENIADNGGMAVTLDIMSRTKDANYQEYFINWAKVWCIKAKPEYQTLLLNVDVHAPAILRANMQPRNFVEWYDAFNVTKKDKMYIAPNKRVVIW